MAASQKSPAVFRVFLSGVSNELRSYREELARVLRRKKIEVREQLHFRQGKATLVEKLREEIDECDAVICLVGDQCGSVPRAEHAAVVGPSDWADRFRQVSGQEQVSYTNWEFILAKQHGKDTYVFLTADGFEPDEPSDDPPEREQLQAAYRDWIQQTGEHYELLTTYHQLIEDVLVLPFPNLSTSKPNNLPHTTLGSLFKGREQFLEDLHHKLTQSTSSATAITTKPHAVHGAGGIGKTRAAIEYAWQHEDDYTALLFLSADSPAALDSSLANLVGVLKIEGMEEATDDVRINAVLSWLHDHPGWLAVLDNVDSEEAAQAAKARLSDLAKGHVLITSRISQWGAGVENLNLGVLTVEAATGYILEATDADRLHAEDDAQQAEAVAKKVGQLAVGLEHAAAYINAQGLRFAEYLQQWEEDVDEILESFDLSVIEYPRELLVTWKLSADRLDEDARSLLEIFSWLAPDPIPDSILNHLPEDALAGKPKQAIASLVKYSLIDRVNLDGQRAFQVHRLVQQTTRYHQLHDEAAVGLPKLESALESIGDACQGDPIDVRDWATLDPLAEHAVAVCDFAFEAGKKTTATTRLLNHVGQLHYAKARFAVAEPLMRRALNINEVNLGKEHPYVATDLNNLAALLQHTNRLEEAERLIRRALQISETSLGKDHSYVATTLNNLAALLRETSRFDEAEPLMRRVLNINEASLGKEHPNVAMNLNNLGHLLKDSNRVEEAEPLLRRSLEIYETSMGKEHPNAAFPLNNLAALLIDRNQLKEAESLLRRALKINQASLGQEHPNVARVLNSLATLLQRTDRHDEAEPLLRRALKIYETSLGKEHPNVAFPLINLAHLLRDTNRVQEAEPLMRRALKINETSLGKEHPNVAGDLNSLATFLQDTNRLEEAEPLRHRALKINEASLGKEHPNVARDLNNLAILLQDTNRLEEAEPLMRRALKINEASLGKEHPNVATALNNLAILLKDTNRLEEAEPLMRRALKINEASLGKEHPNVATALNNLAALLKDTNRLEEAEPLMRRALQIFRTSLGDGHPNTQSIATNYELLLEEMA